MSHRLGFMSDHLVVFTDDCACGSGGYSPHEQYCGVEPVMSVQELDDFVGAAVEYPAMGVWSAKADTDNFFEVYVSTQDNSVKFTIEEKTLTPDQARSLASALQQAAAYAKQKEAAGE